MHRRAFLKAILLLLASVLMASMLFACAAPTAVIPVTVTSSTTAIPPTATPTRIPSEEEIASRISTVSPVTIYRGPGSDYEEAGILDAGTNARVIETRDGNWLHIICPHGSIGNCWVLWDPNAIYLYEGAEITLDIPNPDSLQIVSTNTETSPDGRWEAVTTQSESMSFGDEAWFFYVELKVTAQDTGRTWTPVSEWHAAGLGQEEAPQPFHWSKDGRFLYYSSLSYPDGACVFYDNIGDYLDRLDLTDGSVAAMQPPFPRGIVAISPSETMIAYLQRQPDFSNQHLVVRELATAYDDGDASQDSIKWQIPYDVVWPTQVSQIAWLWNSRKVLVTMTSVTDNCLPASISNWELDVKTGKFVEVSSRVLPTATP